MRVVVTGAFGYVGLALVHRLAGRWPVVAVGHPPRVPVTMPAGVEVVHDDAVAAARFLDGDTALVHLAGGGGEARCRQDPVAAVRTIVHGTSVLAAAARAAAVPARVLASSIYVYGTYRSNPAPYTEVDVPAPDDLYGTCKLAAEHVWTIHGGGLALRIANVYGAGAGVDLGINGAIERFARAAAAGGEITLYGDGRQRIDYVHVDDVCRAIELAITAPAGSLPPAINLGGGAPVSIRELADTCVRAGDALGVHTRVSVAPAPEGKVWPDRSLAVELAARVLGWRPEVELAAAVRALVTMMRSP